MAHAQSAHGLSCAAAPQADQGAKPPAVPRWAVIIRNCNGVAELIGQIHQTEGAAVKMAEYWQEHYCGGAPVTAEVVTFQVPTVGVE